MFPRVLLCVRVSTQKTTRCRRRKVLREPERVCFFFPPRVSIWSARGHICRTHFYKHVGRATFTSRKPSRPDPLRGKTARVESVARKITNRRLWVEGVESPSLLTCLSCDHETIQKRKPACPENLQLRLYL